MIRTAPAPSARPRRPASRSAYREHQYVRALWVATNELAGLAPDVVGGVDDEAELCDLLVIGQGVAIHGGGKAALTGQADLLQRHISCRVPGSLTGNGGN